MFKIVTCTVSYRALFWWLQLIQEEITTFNNYYVVRNATNWMKSGHDSARCNIGNDTVNSWMVAIQPNGSICTTSMIAWICFGHFVANSTYKSIPCSIFNESPITQVRSLIIRCAASNICYGIASAATWILCITDG